MNGIAAEDSLYTSSNILQPWIYTTSKTVTKSSPAALYVYG